MESLFDCQAGTYNNMELLPYWPTEMLDVLGGELPMFTGLEIDGNGLLEPNPLLSIGPSCDSSLSGLGMDGDWFVAPPSLEPSSVASSPDIEGQAREKSPDKTGQTFDSDLNMLLDETVPMESKKWIFNTIFDIVSKYRFHDGERIFPSLEFYFILVHNDSDADRLRGLIARFHHFIAYLKSYKADEALVSLKAVEQRMEALADQKGAEIAPSSCPIPDNDLMAMSQLKGLLDVEALAIAEPESFPIISQEPATKKRKRDADPEDCEIRAGFRLSDELKAPGEYRYNGLVHDENHFQSINDAYLRHARQRAGLAAEDDPTWPESGDRKRQYVKDLFDAITNTVDFHEARKAKAKVEAHNAATRGKAPSASERVLADETKTAVDRLEAVLHCKMSNLEVELVSWKVLEAAMACQQGHTMRALWASERTNSQWDVFETFEARWGAICENMKDCKMMLHSVTRADWVAKLAGAPMKERKNKLNNDSINARKGAQLKAGAKKMLENGP
ncbi:hypothetical protein CMUS01_12766 [Colletotrichum musicola]|uniref:Uncharacterized protein n=1 Tax=Colletotrichum musicola TaxID=2175873 RepID=A0A8H6JJI5_9PEZI|nr:hypothetical protein CMUS01_12766 [Colletotrichum musicola]